MIVFEVGMLLAWGLLFLSWTVFAVLVVIDVVRRRADYNIEDMLGFSTMVFLVWGFIATVMYMVVS